MKQVCLPNGLLIQALNQPEADVLYHEIFTMQAYQKHGIQLGNGDCVIDVGANIGMYSLFLAQHYQRLRLFACEPIPALFAVLQHNAQLYFPQAHLFNVGLSDRARTAHFTFKPSLSMTATMYAADVDNSVQKQASPYAWLQAILDDMVRVSLLPAGLANRLSHLLTRRFVRGPVLVGLLLPLLGLLAFQHLTTQRITCSLQPLSQLIREQHLTDIDLVKIDVEGSELDVIRGIDETDWPRIKQFIIEVHDIDNRVALLTELLTRQGYRLVVDQEDWSLHKLMNIYTLYAYRDR